MTRFTVTWQDEAQDDLVGIWLNAEHRTSVTASADTIDRKLAEDPLLKGEELREGLRVIDVPPLRATFEIILDDLKVIVYRIRLLP